MRIDLPHVLRYATVDKKKYLRVMQHRYRHFEYAIWPTGRQHVTFFTPHTDIFVSVIWNPDNTTSKIIQRPDGNVIQSVLKDGHFLESFFGNVLGTVKRDNANKSYNVYLENSKINHCITDDGKITDLCDNPFKTVFRALGLYKDPTEEEVRAAIKKIMSYKKSPLRPRIYV